LKQQETREKELQKRYDALKHRIWQLTELEKREQATTSVQPVSYNSSASAATDQPSISQPTTGFWGPKASSGSKQ
jgi:hypothetical protein